MGEYLNHERQYTCLGIRLAGHGTRPGDMIRTRWTDWTASVEDGYHLLCGMADRIYLIGLSMGGVLSLLMSTRLNVKGVVAMSTPYRMPDDHPGWLMRLYSVFRPYVRKVRETPDTGWFDQTAYAGHVSYPLNPVRAAAELKILIEQMRPVLPQIRVPVLLLHSRDDTYVPPENVQRIYAELETPDRTKLLIAGCGHVISRDAARQSVFKAAGDFIARVEQS